MWTREELHIRPQPGDETGRVLHVTPASARWDYTGFDVYRLQPGQSVTGTNEDHEICAVVISGAARCVAGGNELGETGLRPTPFDRKPWAMYASAGTSWQATATAPLELAVCSAPARTERPAFLIRPEDVTVETRGTGNNVRHVIDLLPADRDVADRLLVVEALTPAGNSSSYPPHKHDTDDLPRESQLEEVYYYHIEPPTGFAFQRIYTGDRQLDIAVTPADGDVVLVPKGYHPVVAPHGYQLYYLNVMAGPRRIWKTFTDPDHRWLLG